MENIISGNTSGLLVSHINEDSVDIYDGLDMGVNGNTGILSPSTSQLRESMDLYEEIVTEEQKSRESTCTELKSRFQAAQAQIKDLHRRLEQMELQNTQLNTENFRLKKNISALLRTAKQEVTRKDAEIQRLNQESEKDHYPYQSHIKKLRDQNSFSRTSISSYKPQLPPTPPSCPIPPHPSKTESDNSRACIDTRPLKASSHSHSKCSTRDIPDTKTEHSVSKSSSCSSTRHNGLEKQKAKHREEKCQKPWESSDRRLRTGSDANKDGHTFEKNRSDTGRRNEPESCKNRYYINVESRSERVKTPPLEILQSAGSLDDRKGERSREWRRDRAKRTPLETEHKEDYRRSHGKNKASRISESKERKKSTSNPHGKRYSDSSKEREEDRRSKDYERRDDKQSEYEIRRKDKRSTMSEGSRDREKLSLKEPNKGKRDSLSKERTENTQGSLKRSPEERIITEKGSVEENSPNRKLCFMETLNLTLSPIKKPLFPIDVGQTDNTSVTKADDDSSQPNPEDMCVIDEVDSSDLEVRPEEAAEQIPDILKTPVSEKTRYNDPKDVKEDKQERENPTTDKQIEVNSTPTTSVLCKHLDTAEDLMSVNLTPQSLRTGFPKATCWDVLKQNEGKKDILKDECRPPGVAAGVCDTSESCYEQHTNMFLQKVNIGNENDKFAEKDVLDSSSKVKWETPAQENLSVDSLNDSAVISTSIENSAAEDVIDTAHPARPKMSPTFLPQGRTQGPCPSDIMHNKDACSLQDGLIDVEAVSSTITLESLPQEGLSLPEAIYVLTQSNDDSTDSSNITTDPSSSTGCIAVSKVSSTTEEMVQPKKYNNSTSKKNFNLGKGHENNSEPSSSLPLLLHDEDSMMSTLSNLKRIPDAISPLRSPIRGTKRSYLHVHGKPGHVKSLQKDFSNTATDTTLKKLDVNKENKYPGPPVDHGTLVFAENASDQHLSLSDTELEEGEILSDSDEAVPGSPVPATKKVKLARPVRHKPSPKCVLKRTSDERCITSKDSKESPGGSAQSPKSRFKTVCPAATKASFSTVDDVMETFKLIRAQIRKKYMKLHKTFPKKSFYGVMENFQESFLEFADGAQLGQICIQTVELKSMLKKLIASVFSKISNNGIVKRIFEQQAVDLKQKLWDFVDGQVEYLFRDIHTTLKGHCKPSGAQKEDTQHRKNEKVSLAKTQPCPQKEAMSSPTDLNQIKPCSLVPYKTGLGSRGKDIRITNAEKDGNGDRHSTIGSNPHTMMNFLPPKIPSNPERKNIPSLVVTHSSSLLDKNDFELLTEQQASSLTFNLVRDSQMGEIFKCLLQGSDLLENSGITGDNTTWSFGSPRKDGERLISITTPSKYDSPSKLLSPLKFDTPSKLIATWSSVSPRKVSSPQSKDQIPLNPAFFDESCLLEVPTDNRAMVQSTLASQRSYSILAEDLAVSLTIPSPLKSDSHLSFLQPSRMQLLSTPDSVISAHISEDALLEGEDATEQDIHLALDTDNSSCCSTSSLASEELATPFVFKPELPMQALVMERSNDHFIVKIRQAVSGADTTLTADDSLSQTLTENDQVTEDDVANEECHANKSHNCTLLNALPVGTNLSSLTESSGMCQASTRADVHVTLTKDQSIINAENNSIKDLPRNSPLKNSPNTDLFFGKTSQPTTSVGKVVSEKPYKKDNAAPQNSYSKGFLTESDICQPVVGAAKNHKRHVSSSQHLSDSESNEMDVSSLTIAEDACSTPEKDQRDLCKGRKRKKKTEKRKAKRCRTEEETAAEIVSNCKRGHRESKTSPASLSPNSLSAKNVVRKKGEVVISWSRDDDRAILLDLKTKGASRETFSALSERLHKPSEQVAHRFYQLMKLFKKQEKKDPCS